MLGIKTLDKRFHDPIYGIYGFVRLADEIVDTFHDYNKEELLLAFKADTYKAIRQKISLNPVLHAFQTVVHAYNIDLKYVGTFLKSMEMDLYDQQYCRERYDEYIYGSAEVVGLMCLSVFCEGNQALFQQLQQGARSLGAAFQKVNFLRDMQSDYQDRGRVYFPKVNFATFDNDCKAAIEQDIVNDFKAAYHAILQLPKGARMGVYLAYVYYLKLFKKIQLLPATRILSERVRVPDKTKLVLLISSYLRFRLNAI
jgi:phytoene/squalene synthetase